MAKIGMAGTGGHDEVVVRDFEVLQDHPALFEVEIPHFAKQHLSVVIATNDPANWSRDFARRDSCCCDLIEQRLKRVMISPVNQRDPNGQMSKLLRGRKPAKSGSHDHDSQPMLGAHRFRPKGEIRLYAILAERSSILTLIRFPAWGRVTRVYLDGN